MQRSTTYRTTTYFHPEVGEAAKVIAPPRNSQRGFTVSLALGGGTQRTERGLSLGAAHRAARLHIEEIA